jgi:hypothetical protein
MLVKLQKSKPIFLTVFISKTTISSFSESSLALCSIFIDVSILALIKNLLARKKLLKWKKDSMEKRISPGKYLLSPVGKR